MDNLVRFDAIFQLTTTIDSSLIIYAVPFSCQMLSQRWNGQGPFDLSQQLY